MDVAIQIKRVSITHCIIVFVALVHAVLPQRLAIDDPKNSISSRAMAVNNTRWSLQIYNTNTEAYVALPANASADFYGREYLSFSYHFDGQTTSATDVDIYSDLFSQLASSYVSWVIPDTIMQLVANPTLAPCPAGGCSIYDDCKELFNTVGEEMRAFFARHGIVDLAARLNETINRKYRANVTPAATINCVFLLHDLGRLPFYPCDSEYYDLTTDNWKRLKVDDKIQVFINGGNDLSDIDGTDDEVGGLFWPGIGEALLSAEMRRQMTSANTVLNCSLKNPCQAPPDCDMVGQYFMRDKPKWRSPWGYLALWALRNINQELTTQYIAIQAATIDTTLETFTVDSFFPKPNKKFPLLNILTV